jgi:hypothetical protein
MMRRVGFLLIGILALALILTSQQSIGEAQREA